jgi:RimJ/RimL family protein N-acetyltransferase/8-oxo-dGTP pyrophosphatase MutT (NUDIX family)
MPGDVRRVDGRLAAVPSAGIVDAEHGLVLRPPRQSDSQRWFELLHDDTHLRYGTPAFLSLPDGPEKLSTAIKGAVQAHANGQPAMFVIAAASDPTRLLGTMSWRSVGDPAMRNVDVGYGVHPDARGHGVATSALTLLSRWLTTAANGPEVGRVQLDHSVENPASCKVAERAGLPREGVRRSYLPLREPASGGGSRRHDVCLHGLPAGDVPPPRRHRCGTLPLARGRLAVMRRERAGRVYHVALGGGLEPGECVEEAAARELLEEAGLRASVSPADLFATVLYNDGWQYYHTVRSWQGEFGSGMGAEFEAPTEGDGTYAPVWVDLGDKPAQPPDDWRPIEVRWLLVEAERRGS